MVFGNLFSCLNDARLLVVNGFLRLKRIPLGRLKSLKSD